MNINRAAPLKKQGVLRGADFFRQAHFYMEYACARPRARERICEIAGKNSIKIFKKYWQGKNAMIEYKSKSVFSRAKNFFATEKQPRKQPRGSVAAAWKTAKAFRVKNERKRQKARAFYLCFQHK